MFRCHLYVPQYQQYMPHPPTPISCSCLKQQLPYVSASTGDSQGQHSHEGLLHEFQPHKADPRVQSSLMIKGGVR